MRGNHCGNIRRVQCARSIPAYAGEPADSKIEWTDATVYPRVCGGTFCRRCDRRALKGLSPRMRGNPVR